METKTLEIQKIEENDEKKKIQKMRFCIISNFRSQICKNNLLLFTLDNK